MRFLGRKQASATEINLSRRAMDPGIEARSGTASGSAVPFQGQQTLLLAFGGRSVSEITVPAQPVDATLSNQLIHKCLP
jgi:hypothetical protein